MLGQGQAGLGLQQGLQGLGHHGLGLEQVDPGAERLDLAHREAARDDYLHPVAAHESPRQAPCPLTV